LHIKLNTSLILETEPLQEHESSYKDISTADFEPFHISSLAIKANPETTNIEGRRNSNFEVPFPIQG
jgi:hypothetical protein